MTLNAARSQTSILGVAGDILNNYLDDSAFPPGPRVPLDHSMAFRFVPVLSAGDVLGVFDPGAQNPTKFDLNCSGFKDAQNAVIKASGKNKKENPIKLGVFDKIGRALAMYVKVRLFVGWLVGLWNGGWLLGLILLGWVKPPKPFLFILSSYS